MRRVIVVGATAAVLAAAPLFIAVAGPADKEQPSGTSVANCKDPKASAEGPVGRGTFSPVEAVKLWEAKVKVSHGPLYARFNKSAQRDFACRSLGPMVMKCTVTALPCF